MEISGIGRNYPGRPASKDAASAPAEPALQSDRQASPTEDQYDRLVHGLTAMNKATAEAEEAAKAQAKQKLKDVKEQLQFLQRWGFNPEVIARQAAQLGVVLASAAREFTVALAEGGGMALPTSSPIDAGPEMTAGEAPQDAAPAYSRAEQAYRDVMDEDKPSEEPGLSPDDIRTAMEFSAVARQIKSLLEEAARKLREERNAGAVHGTQSLDAAVDTLAGTVSGMSTVGFSITI